MADLNRMFRGNDPEAYSAIKDGTISGAVVGKIISLNDPKKLGRIRVSIPVIEDDTVLPTGSNAYAFVGERFVNNARPGGEHRLLEVGAQVILIPHLGSNEEYFVLDCLPSRYDPPHPDLDRAKKKYGSTTQGGVLQLRDDDKKTELDIFPHGVFREVTETGDTKTETEKGSFQLASDGEYRLRNEDTLFEGMPSGDIKLANSGNASLKLEESGESNLKSPFGSNLELKEEQSNLTGPGNFLSRLVSRTKTVFSGELSEIDSSLNNIQGAASQLLSPDVPIDNLVRDIDEALQSVGDRLEGDFEIGENALKQINTHDEDELGELFSEQVRITDEGNTQAVLEKTEAIAAQNSPEEIAPRLGELLSPIISNRLEIEQEKVDAIAKRHTDDRGLFIPYFFRDLQKEIGPVDIHWKVERGRDVLGIRDKLQGYVSEELLDELAEFFPSPESQQQLRETYKRLSGQKQEEFLLSFLLPDREQRWGKISRMGMSRAIPKALSILRAPWPEDEEEIKKAWEKRKADLRATLPEIFQDESDDFFEEILQNDDDPRKKTKRLIGHLLKKTTQNTQNSVKELGSFLGDMPILRDIFDSIHQQDAPAVQQSIERLHQKEQARKAQQQKEQQKKEAAAEAIAAEARESFNEDVQIRNRINAVVAKFPEMDPNNVSKEVHDTVAELGGILSLDWFQSSDIEEQLQERANSILQVLPPFYRNQIPRSIIVRAIRVGARFLDRERAEKVAYKMLQDKNDLGGLESISFEDRLGLSEADILQALQERGIVSSSEEGFNLEGSVLEDVLDLDATEPTSESPSTNSQEMDWDSYRIFSQIEALISQPWSDEDPDREFQDRLKALQDFLPKEYNTPQIQKLLPTLIGASKGIDDRERIMGAIQQAMQEGTVSKELRELAKKHLPSSGGVPTDDTGLPQDVFTGTEGDDTGNSYQIEDEIERDRKSIEDFDLRSLLFKLVKPLLKKIRPLLKKTISAVSDLLDKIPDILKGADIELKGSKADITTGIAETGGRLSLDQLNAEIGSGIPGIGGRVLAQPGIAKMEGPGSSSSVLALPAIAKLLGPGGSSSVFATAKTAGISGGGAFIGFGGGLNGLISAGKIALQAASGIADLLSQEGKNPEEASPEELEEKSQNVGRKAGFYLGDDKASIASVFSPSGHYTERDNPLTFSDDNQVAEVRADDEGEVYIKAARGESYIHLTPYKIEASAEHVDIRAAGRNTFNLSGPTKINGVDPNQKFQNIDSEIGRLDQTIAGIESGAIVGGTSVENRFQKIETDISDLSINLNDTYNIANSTSDQLDNTNQRIDTLEISIDENVSNLSGRIDSANSSRTALESRVKTLENNFSDNDIPTLSQQVSDLEENVASWETSISDLQGRVDTAESNLTSLQSNVSSLNNTLTIHETDISSLSSQVSDLENTTTTHETDISSLSSQVSDLENTTTTHETDISSLSSQVSDLENTTTQIDTQISNLDNRMSNIEEDIGTIQSDITSINTKLSQILSLLKEPTIPYLGKENSYLIAKAEEAINEDSSLDHPIGFLLSFDTNDPPQDDFDLVLGKTAFTYDNAVAALAFISEGNKKHAKLICDSLIFGQNNDRSFSDGRIRNAYWGGQFPDDESSSPFSTAQLPGWWDEESSSWAEDEFQVSTHTGNMAWTILAWLGYFETYGGQEYLDAAVWAAEWIEQNCRDTNGPGGYMGGYQGWHDPDNNVTQTLLTYKATEHNVDLIPCFLRLYAITGEDKWQERAIAARNFVKAMWNSTNGHFWTGTTPDRVSINSDVIPLDPHSWYLLAEEKNQNNYSESIFSYVEQNLMTYGGFDFNSDVDGVWYEGTSQMALAYRYFDKTTRTNETLQLLRQGKNSKTDALPASEQEKITTGFKLKDGSNWYYFRVPHVGATAWYTLAERNANPFWIGSS